jgi:hypothetical protein
MNALPVRPRSLLGEALLMMGGGSACRAGECLPRPPSAAAAAAAR